MGPKEAGYRRVLRNLAADARLQSELVEGVSDSELAMLLQAQAHALGSALPGLRRLLRTAADRITQPSSR